MNDDLDLQQQIEALQTYMNVVQEKILRIDKKMNHLFELYDSYLTKDTKSNPKSEVVWHKFPETMPEERLMGSDYLIVVRGLGVEKWIETSRFSNHHGFMDFKLGYGKVTHWAEVPALPPMIQEPVANHDTNAHYADITQYALMKLAEKKKWDRR